MNKKDGSIPFRKRRKKSAHSTSVGIIMILCLIICGALWFKTWQAGQEIAAYQQMKEEIVEQIADEEKNQEVILEKIEYLKSDAFIEDLAREKLGLIYEDEIIFKKQGH